jgi:hypothetical protein
MAKKKKNQEHTDEQEELVPMETDSQETESAPDEVAADAPVEEQGDEAALQPEAPQEEPQVELSPDDLLDDVRHSLIEESAVEEKRKESRWWKRIGKGKRGKKETDLQVSETPQTSPEPVMPAESVVEEKAGQDDDQEEYVEQLDELIDMLEDEAEEDVVEKEPAAATVDMAVQPQEKEKEVVDVAELKKRAFRRSTPEEEMNLSEVRSIALEEGGEEVFVEVEARAADPRQERMRSIENALRPYRRYFTFIFIFVSLVMVLLVSASLYRLYLRSLPPPPVEEVFQLPYPVRMNLPGGLSFNLGKGSLDEEGRWEPLGPEWLEGTEICRWIAIPYSRQLEAVVRTFNREDQIELIMSNNDSLTYTVNSINQLSLEEMQKIDSSSPCMMLVLAQADTEKRWVVTAIH